MCSTRLFETSTFHSMCLRRFGPWLSALEGCSWFFRTDHYWTTCSIWVSEPCFFTRLLLIPFFISRLGTGIANLDALMIVKHIVAVLWLTNFVCVYFGSEARKNFVPILSRKSKKQMHVILELDTKYGKIHLLFTYAINSKEYFLHRKQNEARKQDNLRILVNVWFIEAQNALKTIYQVKVGTGAVAYSIPQDKQTKYWFVLNYSKLITRFARKKTTLWSPSE